MLTLRPITPDLTLVYKEIRLRALAESPLAFCSTFAGESRFTTNDWFQRVANFNTPRGLGLLAFCGDQPCGLAGAFLKETTPVTAELVSLWVAPTHRGPQPFGHVATALVDALQTAMATRGATALRLQVNQANHPAMAFYRRLGFAPTGHTTPYPNDCSRTNLEMLRPNPHP